jgi:hypothetical protein
MLPLKKSARQLKTGPIIIIHVAVVHSSARSLASILVTPIGRVRASVLRTARIDRWLIANQRS